MGIRIVDSLVGAVAEKTTVCFTRTAGLFDRSKIFTRTRPVVRPTLTTAKSNFPSPFTSCRMSYPFAVVGLNMTSPDVWRKAPNPAGPEVPDALLAVAAGTFSRTRTSAFSPGFSFTLDGETVTEWGEFSDVAGFVVLAP